MYCLANKVAEILYGNHISPCKGDDTYFDAALFCITVFLKIMS